MPHRQTHHTHGPPCVFLQAAVLAAKGWTEAEAAALEAMVKLKGAAKAAEAAKVSASLAVEAARATVLRLELASAAKLARSEVEVEASVRRARYSRDGRPVQKATSTENMRVSQILSGLDSGKWAGSPAYRFPPSLRR